MNRDPKIVGRAKVGAEMLAEVVNGFVEPISWKTLVRLPIASKILITQALLSGLHVIVALFHDDLR